METGKNFGSMGAGRKEEVGVEENWRERDSRDEKRFILKKCYNPCVAVFPASDWSYHHICVLFATVNFTFFSFVSDTCHQLPWAFVPEEHPVSATAHLSKVMLH